MSARPAVFESPATAWDARLAALDALLAEHAPLWRAQPYKISSPDWCETEPAFAAALLALDEATLERLAADNTALMDWLASRLPAFAALAPWLAVPRLDTEPLHFASAHATRDVAGHKLAQIQAFAGAVGTPRAPLVEWCAGKGHLGRLMAQRHAANVHSLELDPALCAQGRELAARDGAATQTFVTADVLTGQADALLAGRHALALHACGDLHLHLIDAVVRHGARALHLAPCCYHKSARTEQPGARGLALDALGLTKDDLRLAASDTTRAAPREVAAGRRVAAYRFGFAWLMGEANLPADFARLRMPAALVRGAFRAYCESVAAQLCVRLPMHAAWGEAEAAGVAREARARRLTLARLGFRRALELWLVCTRARVLHASGWEVRVGEFCAPTVTPRNLLIYRHF